jgi:hypothetical protein
MNSTFPLFASSTKKEQFSKQCLLLAFLGAFSFGGTILNQYHYALGQLSFYFLVLALATSNFRPSPKSLIWISLFIGYCLISPLIGCYFGDGLCTRKPYTAAVGILLLYFGVEYVAYCVGRYPNFEGQIEKYLIVASWIMVFLSLPYLITLLTYTSSAPHLWQKWIYEASTFMSVNDLITGRFKGLTQEPARLGMVISVLYPIVFVGLLERFSAPRLVLIFGFWMCLLLASTRTGMMTCLLLTFVVLVFYPKKLFILFGLLLACFFLFACYFFPALSFEDVYLLRWLGKSQDLSTSIRAAHSLAAINLWEHNPILGFGLGQSGFVLPNFYPSWYGPNSPEYSTWFPLMSIGGVPSFSFLPQISAEIGLVGICTLLLGIFPILRRSLFQIREDLKIRKYFFSFCGFLIASFGVDGYLYFAAWLIFGILLGLVRRG